MRTVVAEEEEKEAFSFHSSSRISSETFLVQKNMQIAGLFHARSYDSSNRQLAPVISLKIELSSIILVNKALTIADFVPTYLIFRYVSKAFPTRQ